jgi:hypothetical protein
MKSPTNYQHDIAAIRSTMERSVKFLSLSGLSGILAGIYALMGASMAYYLLYYPGNPYGLVYESEIAPGTKLQVMIIAFIVLLLAISTAYLMSLQKAKKAGISLWTTASKHMQINMLIPLASGGLFIVILFIQGYFALLVPACLIFYGLSLIHASQFTFGEIRYLGFTEVIIGIVCTLLPAYGLIFWTLGFGLMHIIYGSVMYYRHD